MICAIFPSLSAASAYCSALDAALGYPCACGCGTLRWAEPLPSVDGSRYAVPVHSQAAPGGVPVVPPPSPLVDIADDDPEWHAAPPAFP